MDKTYSNWNVNKHLRGLLTTLAITKFIKYLSFKLFSFFFLKLVSKEVIKLTHSPTTPEIQNKEINIFL